MVARPVSYNEVDNIWVHAASSVPHPSLTHHWPTSSHPISHVFGDGDSRFIHGHQTAALTFVISCLTLTFDLLWPATFQLRSIFFLNGSITGGLLDGVDPDTWPFAFDLWPRVNCSVSHSSSGTGCTTNGRHGDTGNDVRDLSIDLFLCFHSFLCDSLAISWDDRSVFDVYRKTCKIIPRVLL